MSRRVKPLPRWVRRACYPLFAPIVVLMHLCGWIGLGLRNAVNHFPHYYEQAKRDLYNMWSVKE